MTVVAAYTYDGYLYLFGDLLLSDTREGKSSIELPASGIHPDLRPGNSRISELRQKIVVITPYCALGFAGDFDNAQKLFESLRSKARARARLTYREVVAEINAASIAATKENHEIAIVGWYRHTDGTCDSLHTNATYHKHSSGGDMLVAGTGTDLFLKAFNWVIDQTARYTAQCLTFDPRAHWLFLQAFLVGNEGFLRRNSPALSRLFGGGYELICLREEGFYKTDDVTVVLWEAFCSLTGRPKYAHSPFLAYKMSYVRDALVIRVCSNAGKEVNGIHFPARSTPYVALPPYGDPQQPFPDETELVQLDSQAVCHVVFVNLEDQFLGFFMDIDLGTQRGFCEAVAFKCPGAKGNKSLGCEISEIRNQAFREEILNMLDERPKKPSPA